MRIELDVTDRAVVVFGTASGARRAVFRYARAGAQVTLVHPAGSPGGEHLGSIRCAEQPDPAETAALLGLIGPARLVVLVGAEPALAARARELAGSLEVLTADEEPADDEGLVTLVGGGPGDPGLLTVQAQDALAAADVVFYDRLGPASGLAQLAPAAELCDVGKTPYHHPVPQRSIEELLVARARQGQHVVRLKGGDPFVFGRGGEEVAACLAAGVGVRVVPGVSSAVAVPGSAGIPVTHRGLSTCFTVISGHVPPGEVELAALVQLGGTIVVLMGIANLTQIVTGLCRAGLDPQTPAAIVERGFSESQRSTFTVVGRLPEEARRRDVRPPAVVVVGAVVAAAPQATTQALLAQLEPVGATGAVGR